MKSDRIREMSMEIMVGTFMFVVLLALGVLTIVLSRENIFRTTYPMEVVFSNVHGLLDGDLVTTRGVRVGRVKAIEIKDDGVHVFAVLDAPIQLREGYRVEIVPASILGGQYVSIEMGDPKAPRIPEGTELKGEAPVNLLGEASATVKDIRSVLTDDGVLKDLRETVSHLKSVTAKLDAGEGTMGRLLQDDTLYVELTKVAEDLGKVSEKLANGTGTLGKLMSEDDQLYEDLAAVTGNLKTVSDRLANGQGTLGKLMAEDDALYRDAQLLLQEVRAAVDDLREASPLTTFSSVFFGAF